MFGQVVDSMFTITKYICNDRGLLIQEISKADFEDQPSHDYYEYNSLDSLILRMYVDKRGDTIHWDEYEYFPDGRKLVFRRDLFLKHDPDKDFEEVLLNRSYDTIVSFRRYFYSHGVCDSFQQYNGQNILTKVVSYEYDGDRLVSESHWPSDWALEPTQKTTFYDYSKSEDHPDNFSIDLTGDTVDLCRNEFRNDSLVTKLNIYDYGKGMDKEFFQNGRLIGMIGLQREMNWKIVEAYEYYPNGDLKEIKSYSGEINDGLPE